MERKVAFKILYGKKTILILNNFKVENFFLIKLLKQILKDALSKRNIANISPSRLEALSEIRDLTADMRKKRSLDLYFTENNSAVLIRDSPFVI